MAYDEDLANRVRELLAPEDAFDEKRMFGGLAFMLAGNMAAVLSGEGLMVRVGRDRLDDALESPHAQQWAMGGRPMKDWVMVSFGGVETDDELRAWLARGTAFARALPPK
jgi:TfoX/Sxy family transcriptional regulator of competence genes